MVFGRNGFVIVSVNGRLYKILFVVLLGINFMRRLRSYLSLEINSNWTVFIITIVEILFVFLFFRLLVFLHYL